MKDSIAMLLGAGFSAPMGYPIGNQLNERLQNYRRYPASISPNGKLYFRNSDQVDCTVGNQYSVYLECCISLVEEYSKWNQFDYEVFFEFLAQKEYLREPTYLDVCKSFTNDAITINGISSNIEAIYNQMVKYMTKI